MADPFPPGLPQVETLTGDAIRGVLQDLARLRSRVFRDFPYLYDGTESYEASYLDSYVARPGAAVIIARDPEDPAHIVGAATCLPLAHETANIQAPFAEHGWPVEKIFYYGESVLLAPWRGRGIGVAFFHAREAQARAHGAAIASFCAVRRAPDHPRRPAGHVPLDAFWRHRGFTPVPGLACTMRWKQTDTGTDVTNTLDFWAKSLTDEPLPGAPLPT